MATFSNNYTQFIPEIWSQKLNTALTSSCVMLQCVNRNWEGEISSAGDKVNIIMPGAVAVNTLVGDALTYPELAPENSVLTIDQKKFFAFKINDVAKVQSCTDIMEAHMLNAKKAIEIDQDSYLLGLHKDVPRENIVSTTKTGNITPIALDVTNVYAKFVELGKTLKNANAGSSTQKPWVVINPDIEALLLQSSQFTSNNQIGADALRDGAIGRIAGMDVLVSTNLKAESGTVNVLAGTNEAITFASQIANIESIRDVNSFSDLVRGLYLYGAKTVVPKALAKMACTVA